MQHAADTRDDTDVSDVVVDVPRRATFARLRPELAWSVEINEVIFIRYKSQTYIV